MDQLLTLHIILQKPPARVSFALQKGSGNDGQPEQKQLSEGKDLLFTFSVKLKDGKDGEPDFSGPFVQGPVAGRFVYIGIGRFAGDFMSPWDRRLKIPLTGITRSMVKQLLADPDYVLQTQVPGTGKDGTPNCATVKPFEGWRTVKTP